jgi:hypothetical protein
MDQAALVAKYQQEIGLLRRQLELALANDSAQGEIDAGGASSETNALEIMSLREKIEEEHAAVVEGEQERLRLVERVEELTEALLEINECVGIMQERMRAEGKIGEDESSKEAEKLRDILGLLNNEIRRLKGGGGFAQGPDYEEREDYEVTMQAFYAEREFLNEKLEQQDEWNLVLSNALDALKILVAKGRGIDPNDIDMQAVLSGDYSSIGDLSDEVLAQMDGGQDNPAKLRQFADPNIVEKVMKLEAKVVLAIDALQRKAEKLTRQSEVQKTLTGLNEEVHDHIADLTVENQNLRRELERVEAQNEQLQGYMVDHLSEQELLALIGSLTGAVERVRLTVSTRKISMKAGSSGRSKLLDLSARGEGINMRMSCEDMGRALADLRDGLETVSIVSNE